MKKLLFLLLLPLATQAQKHQLSLLAGPALNDGAIAGHSTMNKLTKPAFGPSAELRYLRNVSKFRIGAGLSVAKTYSKSELNLIDQNGNPLGTATINLTFGNPSIGLSGLFGIQSKGLGFGARLGVVYNSAPPGNPGNPLAEYLPLGSSYGLLTGVYLDYTFFIKNIGLSIGTAPTVQFTHRPAGDDFIEAANFRVLSVPLNIGVHYRF
jgi:hypothetical protein